MRDVSTDRYERNCRKAKPSVMMTKWQEKGDFLGLPSTHVTGKFSDGRRRMDKTNRISARIRYADSYFSIRHLTMWNNHERESPSPSPSPSSQERASNRNRREEILTNQTVPQHSVALPVFERLKASVELAEALTRPDVLEQRTLNRKRSVLKIQSVQQRRGRRALQICSLTESRWDGGLLLNLLGTTLEK